MKNMIAYDSLSSLVEEVKESSGVDLDIELSVAQERIHDLGLWMGGASNDTAAQGFVVGYLTPDVFRGEDYFEENEGAGEFTEFRSERERDNFVEAIPEDTLYYLVDKYEHGNVHYSVSHSVSYPDARFDVCYEKAVLIPCQDVQEAYQKRVKETDGREAKEYFKKDSNAVLQEYSDYCNGEVYCVNILTFDEKGSVLVDESMGGVIGYTHALNTLKEQAREELREMEVRALSASVEIKSLKCPEELTTLPFELPNINTIKKAKMAQVGETTLVMALPAGQSGYSTGYCWDGEKKILATVEYNPKTNNALTDERFQEAFFSNNIQNALRHMLKQQEALEESAKKKSNKIAKP